MPIRSYVHRCFARAHSASHSPSRTQLLRELLVRVEPGQRVGRLQHVGLMPAAELVGAHEPFDLGGELGAGALATQEVADDQRRALGVGTDVLGVVRPLSPHVEPGPPGK